MRALVIFVGIFLAVSLAEAGSEYEAHDPAKDPQAFQDKDGFPTGRGCSVGDNFFKNLDKLKSGANPCSLKIPVNPCAKASNPCSHGEHQANPCNPDKT